MIEGLPVLDAHIHLDPNGDPESAVERFLRAGGSHLLIIHKPYHHIKEIDMDSFVRSYDTTIEMMDRANRAGAVSNCVVGPYPGSLPHLMKNIGSDVAFELYLEALDLAFSYVDEGKAIGIGEVGRVHFQVDEEVQRSCDRILEEAMKGCKKRNCPVILHTESPRDNHDLYSHLVNIADRCSLERWRVIKHYSGWEAADPDIGLGLSVTMQARKNNIEEALKRGFEFLLETDFIDDPRRPNVVMPPDTVPKKITWTYNKGLMDEETHHRLMVDLPEKVLGLKMRP
jgi:TatD-related deoxyribonuclease